MMSKVETKSVLRDSSYEQLKSFKWETLLEELKTHAPLLFHILNSCTPSKREKVARDATVGICASILLRFRNPTMSLVQKIIMLVLHASHCGKKV